MKTLLAIILLVLLSPVLIWIGYYALIGCIIIWLCLFGLGILLLPVLFALEMRK